MTKDQKKKLAILMLNMFIAVGSFGLILPILPEYLRELGEGGTAAGMIIALFAGAQLIFSPIGGRWTDQYGRRKMIILGLFGLGFSMLLFYLAPNAASTYRPNTVSYAIKPKLITIIIISGMKYGFLGDCSTSSSNEDCGRVITSPSG